jgi:hypothetical protein
MSSSQRAYRRLRCDLCGVEIEEDGIVGEMMKARGWVIFHCVFRSRSHAFNATDENYDLCPGCFARVKDFLSKADERKVDWP